MGKANIIIMKPFLVFINYSEMENWSVRYLVSNDFGYNKQYKLFKIGDFLQRNRNTISIKDDIVYSRVTIKLYTKGVKKRDELKGASIGTKKQYVVNSGQFIISKIDARNGAFGIVPESLQGAITTADFLSYNIDETKINPEFLTLLTSTKQFLAYCQGASSGTTGRQRINEVSFLNAKIPLPSINVQASMLEPYNKKIRFAEVQENYARLGEEKLLKYFNESIGIEIKEKLYSIGLLRFISYSSLNAWGVSKQASNNVIYSKNYPIQKISDICNVGSGGTPSRSRADFYFGDIPWIKTGEVINEVIYGAEEKITEDAISNSSAKLYAKGSLIIAMYGQGKTRGRTAKLGVLATTNQACAVLSGIDNSIISTDYLWFYLMNEYERLRELASGNNQPNLNSQMIKDYKVVIPPLNIQNKIVESIKQMKSEIKIFQQQAYDSRKSALEEFEKAIFQ